MAEQNEKDSVQTTSGSGEHREKDLSIMDYSGKVTHTSQQGIGYTGGTTATGRWRHRNLLRSEEF